MTTWTKGTAKFRSVTQLSNGTFLYCGEPGDTDNGNVVFTSNQLVTSGGTTNGQITGRYSQIIEIFN